MVNKDEYKRWLLRRVTTKEMVARKMRCRSGWTSGGRMASTEGGSVPSGVGYVEGCPLSSRLRGLGEPKTDFGVF